ncbi:MAG: hypothetical protein JKY48_08585 [Flavobacteriales bacterium]|nr:hypothetical protein [Flavobacteriales bacterium]
MNSITNIFPDNDRELIWNILYVAVKHIIEINNPDQISAIFKPVISFSVQNTDPLIPIINPIINIIIPGPTYTPAPPQISVRRNHVEINLR